MTSVQGFLSTRFRNRGSGSVDWLNAGIGRRLAALATRMKARTCEAPPNGPAGLQRVERAAAYCTPMLTAAGVGTSAEVSRTGVMSAGDTSSPGVVP